jgi:hypothetical protein
MTVFVFISGGERLIVIVCKAIKYNGFWESQMETMIWIAVPVVLAVLVVVVIKRKKNAKASVYVCSQCGEKDCDCSKQAK